MKIKNKLLITFIITLVFITIYCFVMSYFSPQEKNLEFANSEMTLNADDLVNSFLVNPEYSNNLYTGKIIEITGFVKKVTFLNNRNTVLLYSNNKTSGVICDIHPSQIKKVKKLKEHQEVKVKGICKGFLKDVILLNCHLDFKANE
ncbi:OB-fold protein [Polaribacter aquimarinus]